MFVDPVVSLVLFVGEHGGGRLFVQTSCHCETAGPGADDYNIEKVGEGGRGCRAYHVLVFGVVGDCSHNGYQTDNLRDDESVKSAA